MALQLFNHYQQAAIGIPYGVKELEDLSAISQEFKTFINVTISFTLLRAVQDAHQSKSKDVDDVNHQACKMNSAGVQALVTKNYLVICTPQHRLILNVLMHVGMKQTNAFTVKLPSTCFTKHMNVTTVVAQANVTTVVN
jgi:hypothetical protein